jgi:hypothetical protein
LLRLKKRPIVPRYFFHMHDDCFSRDKDGIELPHIESAREEALRTAGGILRDGPLGLENGGEWKMEVTDATGGVLFTVRFSLERSELAE